MENEEKILPDEKSEGWEPLVISREGDLYFWTLPSGGIMEENGKRIPLSDYPGWSYEWSHWGYVLWTPGGACMRDTEGRPFLYPTISTMVISAREHS